jgi:hypothetical protein
VKWYDLIKGIEQHRDSEQYSPNQLEELEATIVQSGIDSPQSLAILKKKIYRTRVPK